MMYNLFQIILKAYFELLQKFLKFVFFLIQSADFFVEVQVVQQLQQIMQLGFKIQNNGRVAVFRRTLDIDLAI